MKNRKPKNILPGFGLSLGYTILYLSLIVLIPISTIELFGGWAKAQKAHFSDGGVFDQIYQPGR